VTYDLLTSIFQPASPLHDGASSSRASGSRRRPAFCPCRESASEPRPRHETPRRAGLTEENDAVAIVVSEESGTISLAIGGGLERGFEAATLRHRLDELFRVAGGPRHVGRRRGAPSPDGHSAVPNLALKIVSVCWPRCCG
jgi:diadenylate cyclase